MNPEYASKRISRLEVVAVIYLVISVVGAVALLMMEEFSTITASIALSIIFQGFLVNTFLLVFADMADNIRVLSYRVGQKLTQDDSRRRNNV